jgi:seryl-tRNA synthetase
VGNETCICCRYRVAAKEKESSPSDGDAGPPRKKQKKSKGSPTAFCHTLNATACAVPRLIVSIVENFQQADGTINIPEVLQPYMGGMKVIQAVKQV